MDPEKYLILACLEEDNVQRAFFRVRPVLTAEGTTHDEAGQRWPSEGCLRIVPDKNEQHTFKDRMRGMGGWCMLDLTGYSSESNKIRTNKNFNPERGEVNQFIIYSDAVKALPDFLFYEVLDGTAAEYVALSEKAFSPKFFIRTDDALYGPVSKAAPAQPEPAAPGEAVLYPIQAIDGSQHIVLCVPAENRITERPVRTPRQPKKTEAAAAAPVQEKPAEPESAAPATEDAPLPIGKPLNILNTEQTFEETLQDISSQPLSAEANLLHSTPSAPVAPSAPAPVLTGTPLIRSANLRTSTPQPKNHLQEYVSNQCRVIRNDPPAEPLPEKAELKAVVNTVEEACGSLKKAWQSQESRGQLGNCILSLEGMQNRLDAVRQGAQRTTPLAAAFRRHLQDLEAERLAALVELDKAKADTDEYRRDCVAQANDRVKKSITELEEQQSALNASVKAIGEQINILTAERDALQAEIDALEHGTLPASLAKLIAEGGLSAPVTAMPLRLNPVIGTTVSLDDMLHRLQLACEACGVTYQRDRVIAFLVLLAVSPRIGVTTSSPAALSTLGSNLAKALGWQQSYGHQTTAEQKCVVTAAPANGTPAVLLPSLSLFTVIGGLNKIFLARNAGQLTRNVSYEADPWPIFPVQQLPFIQADAIANGAPVSAASLQELLEIHPADPQTVALALKPVMEQVTTLSGISYRAMLRFAGACAGLMEGGLASACDWAILLWLVPAMERKNLPALTELLQEYPLSSAALNAKIW